MTATRHLCAGEGLLDLCYAISDAEEDVFGVLEKACKANLFTCTAITEILLLFPEEARLKAIKLFANSIVNPVQGAESIRDAFSELTSEEDQMMAVKFVRGCPKKLCREYKDEQPLVREQLGASLYGKQGCNVDSNRVVGSPQPPSYPAGSPSDCDKSDAAGKFVQGGNRSAFDQPQITCTTFVNGQRVGGAATNNGSTCMDKPRSSYTTSSTSTSTSSSSHSSSSSSSSSRARPKTTTTTTTKPRMSTSTSVFTMNVGDNKTRSRDTIANADAQQSEADHAQSNHGVRSEAESTARKEAERRAEKMAQEFAEKIGHAVTQGFSQGSGGFGTGGGGRGPQRTGPEMNMNFGFDVTNDFNMAGGVNADMDVGGMATDMVTKVMQGMGVPKVFQSGFVEECD